MSKYLWLIRHGESEGNMERRIQGWLDFPLTNRGRRQAARLAERLAQEDAVQEVVTSPLQRAATTAEIIGAVLGLPVRYDERLKEYNFGPLNGLSRDEIRSRFPDVWTAWQLNEFWEPLPDEEGEPAFATRIRAAIDEVVNGMADESVVTVVMHGGAMNTCLRSWLGIEGRGWRMFAFDNASISLVQLQPKVSAVFSSDEDEESFRMLGFQNEEERVEYNYRILLLNDVSHLAGLIGTRPTWFSAKRSPGKSSD